MRARGWSLDGELVTLAFWRDAEAAARAVETCGPRSGLAVWAMAWRPLDEFATWDGRRLRVLLSERASDDDPEPWRRAISPSGDSVGAGPEDVVGAGRVGAVALSAGARRAG